MIAGVSVEAGRKAMVLVSERPLRVLSSAVRSIRDWQERHR